MSSRLKAAASKLASASVKSQSNEVVLTVPLTWVTRDPTQARKVFDEAAITQLAEEIKASGQLEPVTAYAVQGEKDPIRYMLRNGERRYRALKEAKIPHIRLIEVPKPETLSEKYRLQDESNNGLPLTLEERVRAFMECVRVDGKKEAEAVFLKAMDRTRGGKLKKIMAGGDALLDAMTRAGIKDLETAYLLARAFETDASAAERLVARWEAGETGDKRKQIDAILRPEKAAARADLERQLREQQAAARRPAASGGNGRGRDEDGDATQNRTRTRSTAGQHDDADTFVAGAQTSGLPSGLSESVPDGVTVVRSVRIETDRVRLETSRGEMQFSLSLLGLLMNLSERPTR